ncbi:hypothetical protein F5B20DRAFT_254932 [Whalleya microplaca]|nr:hypothetical protein F5B20DRAFT_254932 [Whalleya microplaca]
MPHGKGIALRLMDWFVRGAQFSCSVVILGIYGYFISILNSHGLMVDKWLRAVVGISGGAIIYTFATLVLLCFLVGHPFVATVSTFFDIIFFGGFIYIAYANRGGARSCNAYEDTPIGMGNADDRLDSANGSSSSPTYRYACRLEKVTLALSIIGLLFFLFSMIVEGMLGRRRRAEQWAATSSNSSQKRWF